MYCYLKENPYSIISNFGPMPRPPPPVTPLPLMTPWVSVMAHFRKPWFVSYCRGFFLSAFYQVWVSPCDGGKKGKNPSFKFYYKSITLIFLFEYSYYFIWLFLTWTETNCHRKDDELKQFFRSLVRDIINVINLTNGRNTYLFIR